MDPSVQAFFLLAPPTVLFRPNIVARALLRPRPPADDGRPEPMPKPTTEHAISLSSLSRADSCRFKRPLRGRHDGIV